MEGRESSDLKTALFQREQLFKDRFGDFNESFHIRME